MTSPERRLVEPFSVIGDPRVEDVLRRLHREADRQTPKLLWHYLPRLPRILSGARLEFPEAEIQGYYADKYLALEAQQAAFCFVTALSSGARSLVEFGTSFGVSTIWLAAAARANGGRLVTTELVPEKADVARRNLEAAGLIGFVELRVGDALAALRNSPQEVDFLLNDGFPDRALEMVMLLAPRMPRGAVVVTDNVGTFRGNYVEFLRYVRNPSHGFASTTVPFKSGTEVSVRVDCPPPAAESG